MTRAEQVGLLPGPGNHGPPSCARVPILQVQRLSLRRGGAFSCTERQEPGENKTEKPGLPVWSPPPSPVGWSTADNLDPPCLSSMTPAAWFALRARSALSGLALRPLRSPRVRGRWYSPQAPWVSGSLPPSPGSHAEGADSDGPGAWRLGAVPGAACAPGPTPSCGGAGFPLRQVRERLKGLGPRGPVRTAPPARELAAGYPRSLPPLRGRV